MGHLASIFLRRKREWNERKKRRERERETATSMYNCIRLDLVEHVALGCHLMMQKD